MARTAKIERKTKETDIELTFDPDGGNPSEINTGIPFLDHMLDLFSAHGYITLKLSAKGDIEIDNHHTVEDIGICLGKALKESLGNKEGIKRYGEATVPMDEAMAKVVIDICNRPYLAYRVPTDKGNAGNFDINLLKEFFRAFVNDSGITMHIDLISGDDAHHIAEAIFKAFGRALDQATFIDKRLKKAVPSTKGIL